MKQFISRISLVVRDYDEAIEFYTQIEPYGKVAVFEDLYGNLWDLVEPIKPQKEF